MHQAETHVFYVLRWSLAGLLEANKPLPQIKQTIFYRFSAVTHSTGSQSLTIQ